MMYLACIGLGIVLAVIILLAVDGLAQRRRRRIAFNPQRQGKRDNAR